MKCLVATTWWVAATLAVVPLPAPLDDVRQRTTGLTGVIGHWTESVDGTAVITVDGGQSLSG